MYIYSFILFFSMWKASRTPDSAVLAPKCLRRSSAHKAPPPPGQTDSQKDRQTYRQTDIKTNRQTDSQTDKQTKNIEKHTKIYKNICPRGISQRILGTFPRTLWDIS